MKKIFSSTLKGVLGSLVLTSLLISSAAFTASIEEAQDLFSSRDYNPQGIANAKSSADMYAQLASTTTDPGQKAELLTLQSASLYFVGDASTNNSEKIKYHLQGKDVALSAAAILEKRHGEAKEEAFKETLARSYFWFGANMARWGEANGILSSLGQWPTVQRYMEYIIEMGQAHVEYYGANRVLGRAYYKLPFPLGSNRKSLAYLEEAFNQTLDDGGDVSLHALNVIYYADTLIAIGGSANREKARQILTKFIEKTKDQEAIDQYNPDRIPETRREVGLAKDVLDRL